MFSGALGADDRLFLPVQRERSALVWSVSCAAAAAILIVMLMRRVGISFLIFPLASLFMKVATACDLWTELGSCAAIEYSGFHKNGEYIIVPASDSALFSLLSSLALSVGSH